MSERNEFDCALRDLALKHAPRQVAQCGAVVTAHSQWRKPHRVRITKVAVEVCGIALPIAQRATLGLTGWLAIQHWYIGQRLNADGTDARGPALLLTEFTTDAGGKYERIPSSFNHCGLVFHLENKEG